MNIEAIESFLYKPDSDDQQIISFLNFLYTKNERDKNLTNIFFNAFENAYTKSSINAILNRKPKKDDDSKDKDIQDIIHLKYTNEFRKKIYKVIQNGTTEIKKAHKVYLDKLKNQPIKHIIIGEAPPFSFIKVNENLEFKNNYILSNPSAGIWQSSIRDAFVITKEKKKNDSPCEFIKGLVNKNILFLDIIPVTLPFSTDIRKGWIDKKIEDNDTPLLVSLLQLAIQKSVDELTIDPNVKVAFVTPPKTSISIFDYYSDKKLKIKDNISVDITIINDNTTKKKYEVSQDIILPMYKANAMMGSNAPSPELLKLALDL